MIPQVTFDQKSLHRILNDVPDSYNKINNNNTDHQNIKNLLKSNKPLKTEHSKTHKNAKNNIISNFLTKSEKKSNHIFIMATPM